MFSQSKDPKTESHVRVRYAPSPTGYLHIGGARTALYNYLFAKQNKGQFILRIEDTDEARSTEESLKMVIEDLMWLGLQWDEGPDPHTLKEIGSKGPYRQSQRLQLYKNYADQLIQSGQAYYCFMTDAEIEIQREKLLKEGKSPHVESPYVDLPVSEALVRIKNGESAVVRFKTGSLKKDFIFTDLVRGEVKFPSDMVSDFVLLRSGGMPVYNFCNVIDDYLMGITHVLRGEEHLPNTLRQLMLYEAYGWKTPQFGHLSLILDEDRKKLSKRNGATSCYEFKMEGYLPEALNNFIALLGWSHPEEKEIISMNEMIKSFSVSRLNHSGAVFDAKKLRWMNSVYLRALSDQDLWNQLLPFLKRENIELPSDHEWQMKSVSIFRPYLETFADAISMYKPLCDRSFVILSEAKEVLEWDTTKQVLLAWRDILKSEASEYISESRFLEIQDDVKNRTQAKGKFLFMPMRVAVIGKPHGTELKILVPLIKVSSLIHRADICLQRFH